jgi:hypothetical protein
MNEGFSVSIIFGLLIKMQFKFWRLRKTPSNKWSSQASTHSKSRRAFLLRE